VTRHGAHKACIQGFRKPASKKGDYHVAKQEAQEKKLFSCTTSGEQERWRNFSELIVRKKS